MSLRDETKCVTIMALQLRSVSPHLANIRNIREEEEKCINYDEYTSPSERASEKQSVVVGVFLFLVKSYLIFQSPDFKLRRSVIVIVLSCLAKRKSEKEYL